MAQEKCIKELLDEKVEDAKVGEFLTEAQVKLEELAKCVGPEEQSYRDKLESFWTTWREHDSQVNDLEQQIKTCYPKWEEYLEKPICSDVIKNIEDLKEKIKNSIGSPEWKLNCACETFDASRKQLDAWKAISKTIKARLDANALLIEELCKRDNCKDRKERLCVIYIFFFELLPAHKQLEKPFDQLPEHHRDPESRWCSSCDHGDYKPTIDLCGYPWLIEPSQYDCKLADVWKIWCEAGTKKVKAQCDFDAIALCKIELASAIDPINKRNNACAALRDFEEKYPENCKNNSTAE